MAPGDRLREDLESAMPAPGDVIVNARPGAEGRDGARLPLAEKVSGARATRVGSPHGTYSTWRWRPVACAARDQRAHPWQRAGTDHTGIGMRPHGPSAPLAASAGPTS
jgi:hypothetical protein